MIRRSTARVGQNLRSSLRRVASGLDGKLIPALRFSIYSIRDATRRLTNLRKSYALFIEDDPEKLISHWHSGENRLRHGVYINGKSLCTVAGYNCRL